LERRLKLKMTTSVMRTIEKVGGLDAYLMGTTRRRMKELGPRGWELRAKIIQLVRDRERGKHVRMLQRSILLCPMLRMDSEWNEIRPLIQHTEGYALLQENVCQKAFESLMERLREGRPVRRRTTARANRIYGGDKSNRIVGRVMVSNRLKKASTTQPPVNAPRAKPKIKTAKPKRTVQTQQKKDKHLPKTMKELELAIQKAQEKLKKKKKNALRRRTHVKPKTGIRIRASRRYHSQEFLIEARKRIRTALARRRRAGQEYQSPVVEEGRGRGGRGRITG